MNRKYYSAFAVSAVAMGAVVFTATEASATMSDPQPRPTTQAAPDWPDEGSGYPGSQDTPEYNYPKYDRQYEVVPTKAAAAPSQATVKTSSDGDGFQFVQSGASAAAGAAVAVSCLWMYRRRQTPTT
ncbi:hypothetical protein ACXC9Q_30205 [Kribbella sp. CWNU-51]